jgi:peptidoglycan-N-acetylmuramic acid deacetylase
MKLKRIIIFAALLCAVLNITASANENLADNKNYSWYFKPVPDNKQPDFDVNLEDLKNYDTYAIGSPDDKVIYLTFDFGYENGNVKKCLDALNNNDVKGAFFILEHVIKANTDLIKEIAETGHIVANHTMKHKNMCYIKDINAYEKELKGLEELYEEMIGHKMAKFYRPPKGEFTKQNLEYNKKLGYKTILWSVAYKDWDDNNQPNQAEAIKKILKLTHNGAVVLIHPTSNTNAAILDTLIKEWKSQGYRFGTLDELA